MSMYNKDTQFNAMNKQIAEKDKRFAELEVEREQLLATLEFMQQDRDDWQDAHNALRAKMEADDV